MDSIPADALESFAGAGYFVDLDAIQQGERVLDLGSGSGADTFAAATLAGATGEVTGLDTTKAQLAKAERLRLVVNLDDVLFVEGHIGDMPMADGSCDVAVSNGVINLTADRAAVSSEVARVLVPGGRLALADIVSQRPLAESITCDAELWAACVGGAPRSTTILARSNGRVCASTPPGITPLTRFCPGPQVEPRRRTALRASRCSPSNLRGPVVGTGAHPPQATRPPGPYVAAWSRSSLVAPVGPDEG